MNNFSEIMNSIVTQYLLLIIAFLLVYIAFIKKPNKGSKK